MMGGGGEGEGVKYIKLSSVTKIHGVTFLSLVSSVRVPRYFEILLVSA